MPSAPTSEAPSVTVVPSATAASEPPTETKPPPVTSTVATEPVTTAESPEPPSAAPQATPSASVMTTPNPLPHNISAPVTAEAGPTATVAESAPPPTPPSEATGSVATTSDTPTSISGSPVRTSGVLPSASPPVSQAGQVFEVHQAEQLQAPREDVELARASAPVELRPDPAPKADVDGLRNAIGLRNANADWNDPTAPRRDRDPHEWDKSVRQWDRDWVQYDDWYRPILCNPYRQPVKIVYVYLYQPRIVLIPPLASVVLGALEYGAYNFTALLLDPVGTALNLAVGSFFGGGYYPGQYLAPPPPPPLVTYDEVPVVVSYRQATYEPFLVRRIVDVGDDVRYGERKVLLDGVTPVWGQWTQNPYGQRTFEVHKTQRFPGLEDPKEGPLPGGYQLRLAGTPPPGFTARDVYVMTSGAVLATLAVGWAVLGISRRRRRPLH